MRLRGSATDHTEQKLKPTSRRLLIEPQLTIDDGTEQPALSCNNFQTSALAEELCSRFIRPVRCVQP
jgi:hypothetical protein